MADNAAATQTGVRGNKKTGRRTRRRRLRKAKQTVQAATDPAEHIKQVIERYMNKSPQPDIHIIAEHVGKQCCVQQRKCIGTTTVSTGVLPVLSSVSMICVLFVNNGQLLCFSKFAQQDLFQLPLNPKFGIKCVDIVYYNPDLGLMCKGCTFAVTNLPMQSFNDVNGYPLSNLF